MSDDVPTKRDISMQLAEARENIMALVFAGRELDLPSEKIWNIVRAHVNAPDRHTSTLRSYFEGPNYNPDSERDIKNFAFQALYSNDLLPPSSDRTPEKLTAYLETRPDKDRFRAKIEDAKDQIKQGVYIGPAPVTFGM